MELASNALGHQWHIRERAVGDLGRHLAQYVARVEVPSGPADPSKVNVAVEIKLVEFLADICKAGAVAWSTTSL